MDYKEYTERLRDLGVRFVDDGTRAWERYAKVVGDASSGRYRPEEVQKRMRQFAQTEGPDFIRKLMQCHMDYYMGIMDAGLDFSNRMFESLFKEPTGQPGAKAPGSKVEEGSPRQTGKAAPTEIHFTGSKGKSQSESFLVANKQGEEVEVSFEISEFISEDGKTKIRLPVKFKPHHFVLGQGKEQIVECQVTFQKSLRPGQRYSALARMVGFPDRFVRLIVTPKD
jgi:hypothetical protein